MRHFGALVLLGAAAPVAIAAGESSRPRGVGPEFAKFYKNPDAFACISHPSIILTPSQVNDNYCDCPDGSDEPGTSACTYLSSLSPPQPLPGSPSGTTNTTNALPGFYCKNKGHVPDYVDFRIVNDGVCDYDVCCDGSDEWEGVGGVRCQNLCEKMGLEHRKKVEALEKSALAARKKREELVREAAKLRSAVVDKLSKLEKEIGSLKVKEAAAKTKFEDIETRERGRIVAGGEGKQSKVTVLAGLAKQRIEELRDALTATMLKRDEAREKVIQLEGILSTFKDEYNPNFNDEGVKRAVKAWEDYAANKNSYSEDNAEVEKDIAEAQKEDSDENGINWAEWQEEEESDIDALYRFEEYLPLSIRTWLHEKMRDVRLMLIDNGILADNTKAGSESRLVTDAKLAYQAVTDELTNKEAEVGIQTSDLEKDYGPDDVFRALKGRCVSQDSGEYTYELCWMDRTTQKSKKGGGNTGMGTFVRFDTTTVDEEVGADGKGLGSGERMTLIFENGQHCWNGPNRATTVVVACAEKDEIWKISELEKCIYQMDVGSPAACVAEKKAATKESRKDEL